MASPIWGAIHSNSLTLPGIGDSPSQLYKKAEKFQEAEKNDSALIYYSWVAENFKNAKERPTRILVGKSLSEMGQIYYTRYSNYSDAYRCLDSARTIFEETDDRQSLAIVLLNLGNLFNIYDYAFSTGEARAARAHNYYDQALNMASDCENWNLVCATYINQLMLDLPFKVNTTLNSRMIRLLSDSIPPGNPNYALSRQLCFGTNALDKGQLEEASRIFANMRDSLSLGAPRDINMADLCLSAVSIKEKDSKKALSYLYRIIEGENDINDIDVRMEVYDLMSRLYEMDGAKDQSVAFRIKYYEAKDSLTKQIVDLEPTKIGIELENVKDYAHNLDTQKKQIIVVTVCLILLIAIMVVAAVMLYRKNRLLTQKNKVIFDQTRDLLKSETASAEIAVDVETQETDTQTKYRDSSLTDETRNELIKKIEDVMNNVSIVCDKDFSLQRLTTLVGSNTSYISRVINEHYGLSFATLINKIRVREACRRLEDTETYGRLTIDAISESVGFNTRSTFTKAFRTHIGMLPSEYAKLLKNQD